MQRLSCFLVLVLCIGCVSASDDEQLVDGDRLNATMNAMRTFGENSEGGSDRIAFTQLNVDALKYLEGLMQEAGLTTHTDFAGNLIGTRSGSDASLGPLVTGSHIDTVINGGHFDGIVGVMAGIEAATVLEETGTQLRHPLEIVVWTNEEAGKVGSRSINGSVARSEMNLKALGDKTIGEGIRFLGGDPDRLAENTREPGSVAGYIELHVEQGGILEREDVSIGVVTGIVGIRRWNITVDGFANHAGTTPMSQRQDAMFSAARLIVAIREVITGEDGAQVGTVGRIQAFPGAPNVVPGQAKFSLEIRDLDMDKIERLYSKIRHAADAIAKETETGIQFEQFYLSPAAVSDTRISSYVEAAANDLGLSSRHMPSGAGHDAQSFKDIAPLGMIFVPSRNGVSHAPTEFTSEEQITNGTNVLLKTLLAMDENLD